MGRHLIPGRAGVTTEGVANKYRARCVGRGRCGRGCDLQAPMHSPTALIFPARDTGNLTLRPNSTVAEVLVDANSGKASGVRVIDSVTKESFDFTRQGGDPGGVVASRSTRLLLLLEVGEVPERDRQLVGRRRPLLQRAHHGPARHRLHAGAQAARRRPTTTAGRSASTSRASATLPSEHKGFLRGYGFQGRSGSAEYPGITRTRRRASAPASRRPCATCTRRRSRSRRSARCWPAARTSVELDPTREGRLGHPGAALRLPVRRERAGDGQGHGGDGGGDAARRRRRRDHGDRRDIADRRPTGATRRCSPIPPSR